MSKQEQASGNVPQPFIETTNYSTRSAKLNRKNRAAWRDGKGMKRFLIAIGLAVVIPACHGGQTTEIVVGAPPALPSTATTTLLLQATNYDTADYAVWIEWQDDTGRWVQEYLFSLYGDPRIGPTINYQIVLANPSIPYYVLLADPWGTLYDSFQIWLPVATSVDITFNVIDGYLYRTS
jgi:hypothetical protein